jgi:hypothetical protein
MLRDMAARPHTVRRAKLAWYVASSVYSLVYILLAARIAGPYGLPVLWFAAVEILATFPYTLGVGKVIDAVVARRPEAALRWGMVAMAGFLAPDVFILLATPRRPWWLVVVVAAWVAVTATLAARSLTARIAARRKLDQTPAGADPDRPADGANSETAPPAGGLGRPRLK